MSDQLKDRIQGRKDCDDTLSLLLEGQTTAYREGVARACFERFADLLPKTPTDELLTMGQMGAQAFEKQVIQFGAHKGKTYGQRLTPLALITAKMPHSLDGLEYESLANSEDFTWHLWDRGLRHDDSDNIAISKMNLGRWLKQEHDVEYTRFDQPGVVWLHPGGPHIEKTGWLW